MKESADIFDEKLTQPLPTLLQIEAGIKSTGKYRQEDGYSLTAHQAYVDGWYDAIDFMNKK
jgi:hypothetical protein